METFSDSDKSINAIRQFLNGRDGVSIGSTNVSQAGLFSTAETNDVNLPNGNFVAPHALSEFAGANYTNATVVNSINSSNIKETCEALILDPGVLSAGPLFGNGTARYNLAGAYEIVLAPGYRIKGDNGTHWTRSRRYVIDVESDGFVYNRHFRYQVRNERSASGNLTRYGLSTASSTDAYEKYVDDYSDLINYWNSTTNEVRTKSTWGEDHWRNHGRGENRSLNLETAIEIEKNTSGFTAGTVLEFNHPVRWGNAGSNVWQRNFYYTLPLDMVRVTIIGGGGGGGSSNSTGDAGAGSGGDSGGARFSYTLAKSAGEVARIRVGRGGIGAGLYFNGPLAIHPNGLATDNVFNDLWDNYHSFGFGQRGLNSAIKFGSASEIVSTGGGGGIAAFNGTAVAQPADTTQNTGPGSPGGVAGAVPVNDSDLNQPGGNLGSTDNMGDGGIGMLYVTVYGFGHQVGQYGQTSQGHTSGADGAVWIVLG